MKSKKDLISTVAEATDFSKATVETVVNAFLKEIIDSLTAKEPVRTTNLVRSKSPTVGSIRVTTL